MQLSSPFLPQGSMFGLWRKGIAGDEGHLDESLIILKILN